MNDLYENLAEEAMVHVPGAKGLHTRTFSLEKYTELVVRRCAQIGEDTDGNSNVKHEILKEFGLK